MFMFKSIIVAVILSIQTSSMTPDLGKDFLPTVQEIKIEAVQEMNKAEKIKEETKESAYTGFIQDYAGAKASFLNKTESYYNMIPENARLYMENKGWQYLVTSHEDTMKAAGVNFSILGYTDIKNRKIYLDNRKKADTTILHEFAHGLDFEHGFALSKSEEFAVIFEAERDIFISFHSTHKNNTSTQLEYFAEAFAKCITDPQSMMDNCPATYTYIINIVNGLITN